MAQSGHTVVAFDLELQALHRTVCEMGAIAADQLGAAVAALVARDEAAAAAVLTRDAELDEREAAVEAKVLRVLALRQPMARDLREVISALKIAHDLERVGDFAANCAKRTMALTQFPPTGPLRSLERMSELAGGMVRDVVDAYVSQDFDKAMEVRARDVEVDALYTSLFRELLTYMMEGPQHITPCTHLLFVAKNIERVGDHATNVAESVCFLIRGRLPDGVRSKEDLSSFTVVESQPPAPGR